MTISSRTQLRAAIGTNVYTHAYDGIGNHILSGVNSVTNQMENNQLNQLKRIVSSDGSTTNAVFWNVHGGMARDDLWTYTYDAEDQLVSVTARSRTNGAIRVRNAYDCRHRRIAKIVERLAVTQAPPPALPVTLERWDLVERRDFVWDDWNIVHEFATAVDGVSTNVTEIQYFWGLDLSDSLQGAGGVGGLLAVSRNGSFYFPVYDSNGNVMKYIDESGTVAAAYVYDDFGKIVSQTGSLADAFNFRFSTKYFDQECDLCSYQLRSYKPEDKCWINRDPLEEEGGVNVYGFVQNSALIASDNLGMAAFMVFVGEASTFDLATYQNKLTEAKPHINRIVSSLNGISDEVFECVKKKGDVYFGTDKFTGTRKEYIGKVKREKTSYITVVTGYKAALASLERVAASASETYDYFACGVHGGSSENDMSTIVVRFPGQTMRQSDVIAEMNKKMQGAKGTSFVVSCYQNWDGKGDKDNYKEYLTLKPPQYRMDLRPAIPYILVTPYKLIKR